MLNKQLSTNSKTIGTTALPAALLCKRVDYCSFYLTVLSFNTHNSQSISVTKIEKITFVSPPLEKGKKENSMGN